MPDALTGELLPDEVDPSTFPQLAPRPGDQSFPSFLGQQAGLYGSQIADAYRRFGGDAAKAYNWLFGHTGKSAGLPPVGSEAFGGTTPSVMPTPSLPARIVSNNPQSPYFSGNSQNPGNPFQGPGGQNIPPQPTPGMTLNSTPATAAPAAAPASPPLPAPGAQARPTSTGAMPPRTATPSSGRGGNASGNRIPPQSVNLGYGAPGVGHYVPTTGIGRGPGTYVPGYQGDIVSGTDLGSQIHNLGVNIGRGLNNAFGIATPPPNSTATAQPAMVPGKGIRQGNFPYGQSTTPGGPFMPVDITGYKVAGVNAPLGPLARTGTQNLPTSYMLPGGSRLTPQGDVIPP